MGLTARVSGGAAGDVPLLEPPLQMLQDYLDDHGFGHRPTAQPQRVIDVVSTAAPA